MNTAALGQPVRLPAWKTCDVLVIGSGIAGLEAALAAASAGRRVVLASRGPIFSGSSFYPGTWGLGLIGPENGRDEADLAASILAVGRGMADPALVSAFVAGITPAVDALVRLGVRLKEAAAQGEREFIPCFDHKHRAWHGLLFQSVREVFARELARGQVTLLPGLELLELTRGDGRVDGAVLGDDSGLYWISCGAVVLAAGGLGGLYQDRLTTADVDSSAHWMALCAGAELVNLEFMQIMPGYLRPCPKTIFNEKTFRWVRLLDASGADLLAHRPDAPALLEQRSSHGPFTSALADREIDLAILRHQAPSGVTVRYSPELSRHMPEFIATYIQWLAEEKGVGIGDPIQIGLFAHASNGGIRIDGQGSTGVPGLYAAGEITGGMHGADRIGGLSTANGLVFGARAGAAAAAACAPASPRPWTEFRLWHLPEAAELQADMRRLMTRHALVLRRREGLEHALDRLSAWREGAGLRPGGTPGACVRARSVMAQLGTAQCVLRAQLLRTESRGSHFREDFPAEDPALARQIVVRLAQGSPQAGFRPDAPAPAGGSTPL